MLAVALFHSRNNFGELMHRLSKRDNVFLTGGELKKMFNISLKYFCTFNNTLSTSQVIHVCIIIPCNKQVNSIKITQRHQINLI